MKTEKIYISLSGNSSPMFEANCIEKVMRVHRIPFGDANALYRKGEEKFKKEAQITMRRMHLEILNGLSDGYTLIFSEKTINNEGEYIEFLKEVKDIFSGYIEVIEKDEGYTKLKE